MDGAMTMAKKHWYHDCTQADCPLPLKDMT